MTGWVLEIAWAGRPVMVRPIPGGLDPHHACEAVVRHLGRRTRTGPRSGLRVRLVDPTGQLCRDIYLPPWSAPDDSLPGPTAPRG